METTFISDSIPRFRSPAIAQKSRGWGARVPMASSPGTKKLLCGHDSGEQTMKCAWGTIQDLGCSQGAMGTLPLLPFI